MWYDKFANTGMQIIQARSRSINLCVDNDRNFQLHSLRSVKKNCKDVWTKRIERMRLSSKLAKQWDVYTLATILIGGRATLSDFIFPFRVEYLYTWKFYKFSLVQKEKEMIKLHFKCEDLMIAWNNKPVLMWEHN